MIAARRSNPGEGGGRLTGTVKEPVTTPTQTGFRGTLRRLVPARADELPGGSGDPDVRSRLSRRPWPALILAAGTGLLVTSLALELIGLGQGGIGPDQVALGLAGLGIALCGAILLRPTGRWGGEWALVGSGVVSVLVAAQLIDFGGPLRFGVAPAMIALVGFAGWLGTSVASGAPAEGSGEHSREQRVPLRALLALLCRLTLLVVVIRQYRLEHELFYRNLALLTLYGFLVHSLLSARYRLPFFLLLSIGVVIAAFGVWGGAQIIGTGCVLIAICHLPIRYALRVSLLLAVGAVLAAMRADWLPAPWDRLIWPVLASMFMFRLIVYMYDLKHESRPQTVTGALSYFFLFPNVAFPFFPVVDYKTFRRTYYDDRAEKIYQRGVDWIFRGVVHLLLYRVVYYYLTISPTEVTNTAELAQHFVSNFLLYLRVSGQFHLVVGVLHLFGFHLPETHRLYYLAESFTDFWRRINIYWKDFMMKVVYYPTFFRIRQWGATTALVIATLLVFLCTWFFHAYQWFWLRGSFLLSATDILFWAVLAVLVVANALHESKHGRDRSFGPSGLDLRRLAPRAVKVAATFTTICILWSLWTSASLAEWLALWSAVSPRDVLVMIVPAVLVGMLVIRWSSPPTEGRPSSADAGQARRSPVISPAVPSFVMAAGIWVVGLPGVTPFLPRPAADVVADLKFARLSDEDATRMQRGYYEHLAGVDRFNSQLWDVYMNRPLAPGFAETVGRTTGDFLKLDMIPASRTIFRGKVVTSNSWGMRDREYAREKPAGTVRLALLGSSHAMGWGVGDTETFESILENRLNDEPHAGARYEILNLAVGSHSPLQILLVWERKALSFGPDAVLYTAHLREAEWAVQHLVDRVRARVEMPDEYLRSLFGRAGVGPESEPEAAERLLAPYGKELLAWVYGRIVDSARARAIVPVWVHLPDTWSSPGRAQRLSELIGIAERAGFTVINLADVYDGRDPRSLQLASWDTHPNAVAHRLVAERLFDALHDSAGGRLLRVTRGSWGGASAPGTSAPSPSRQ
jgi:D-alanyl-lipoteichoic acid acyltransferase DltB (MBOAT superfamily)